MSNILRIPSSVEEILAYANSLPENGQTQNQRIASREKISCKIHSYHDDDSAPLNEIQNLKIEQLKSRICALLQSNIGMKREKSENIVKWIPRDSITNLDNICQSLQRIFSNERAKEVLKKSLHFEGSQPKETISERLQLRATILYSLSWSNTESDMIKYTNSLEEVSDLCKKCYSVIDKQYTNDRNKQMQMSANLFGQLTRYKDALVNKGRAPETNDSDKEAIRMLLIACQRIAHMIN